MPDFEIRDLQASYGAIQVLHGISLKIAAGRRAALIGSNGAGKTTLVKAINGLLKSSSGKVFWNGIDISDASASSRVRSGVATVAEGRFLFPGCTIEENLHAASTYGAPKAARQKTIEDVFALFPRLKERARQRAGTLSGGEQQMLAIGRALMTLPSLLILDEPSIGLAPRVVGEIFEVLARLGQSGITLLLVEQNVMQSLKSVDYGYVIQRGRVVTEGASADLLKSEQVRVAYLGE